MSVIFNFIRAKTGTVYGHVTTISFLTSPTYYKLKNAALAHENSVHTINLYMHLIYEVPATVNVYREECSFSNADLHFFPNNSP